MPQRFKYIKHKDIDFERWDLCISSLQAPQPYGFSWYLNWLVPQWDAIVYGDYEVILPIFLRTKNGLSYTTRPFGTQSTGPYAKIPLSTKWIEDLINEATRYVKYGEFFLAPGTPLPAHFKPEALANYSLQTNDCYEALYSAYSKQNKRNIKKANAIDLQWAEWSSIEEAVSLWKLNTQSQTAITDENLERLKKLMEFCKYQNKGTLYAVRDEYNQLIGAHFWIIVEGRSTLILNATNDYGKEHGVSAWLIDQHIRTVASSDHVIDFEGSSLDGLARFYSGFGATNHPFFMHVENRLPIWARYFKQKTTKDAI